MERYECLEHCPINCGKKGLSHLIKERSSKIGELSASILYYAPVGNIPENPKVIICGKTPGIQTKDDFWARIYNGSAPQVAAIQTVYSNMRDNLYLGLEWIGLFDCLAVNTPYWKAENKKAQWDAIFTDEEKSQKCGIQFTQACDCAIVGLKNGKESSNQPKKSTVRMLSERARDCLFNSFIVTPSLRLIIFLDTPGEDNQFHTSTFFEQSSLLQEHNMSHVARIPITHTSGQNNDIYMKLPYLTELANNAQDQRKKTRYRHAAELFSQAKETVQKIKQEWIEEVDINR